MNKFVYMPLALSFIVLNLFSCSVISQEKIQLQKKQEIQLECTLSAETKQNLADGIWITFGITSNQSLELLPWQTPLEGILGNLFKITDINNNQLPYEGPMVKRRAPESTDYISMQKGIQIQNKVDLALAYSFTEKQQYQIELNDLLFNLIDREQNQFFIPCQVNQKLVINIE